jgi:uncharacterized membrane protein YfcA
MYKFSTHGFTIIFVSFLICLVIFFYSRQKIKERILRETSLTNKKYGIFWLLIGSVLSLISLVFHIYFQLDFISTPELLKPLSAISAEPIIVLTIMAFLLGLTILFIGISSFRFRKKIQIREKK